MRDPQDPDDHALKPTPERIGEHSFDESPRHDRMSPKPVDPVRFVNDSLANNHERPSTNGEPRTLRSSSPESLNNAEHQARLWIDLGHFVKPIARIRIARDHASDDMQRHVQIIPSRQTI